MYQVPPLIGALPSALVIGAEVVQGSTDWATYTAQLGVGAVLVAFAVWLSDKLGKERRAEVKEVREELKALREKHDADMAKATESHEKTRQQLIAALMQRNPQ